MSRTHSGWKGNLRLLGASASSPFFGASLARGLSICASLAAATLAGCIQRSSARQTSSIPAPARVDPDAPLPDGLDVLGKDARESFQLQGEAALVDFTSIEVTDQPFDRALRATIKEAGGSAWSVQVTAKNVEKGDVMLATFYARVVTSRRAVEEKPSSCSSVRAHPTRSR